MRAYFLCSVLFFACGSPSTTIQPAPPPPPLRPPLGPPPCARPVAGGFMDDRLVTRCTFRTYRGARVCVPDNMGFSIFGVCDPKGGPDRIWVNREPSCLGNGTSPYIVHLKDRPDDAADLKCDPLEGTIGVTDPTPVADQTLYIGSQSLHKCESSPLSGNTQHPVQNIAPPPAPVYIYEADLPSQICPR